jgi:hypothetical protein
VIAAIDATMIGSVLASVALARLARWRWPREPEPAPAVNGRVRAGPGSWLAALVVALLLNQVLFTVYVVRVHGGDASFIARYLPSGWFALASHNRVVVAIARAFPAPGLLAPTVLRVQAALELPLVLLAYLCAARWLDRRLYQSLVSPIILGAASASYTLTFSLIEWSLRNPYTGQDLALRAITGVFSPMLIHRLARRTREADLRPPPARSTVDILLFAASAGALGYLVLVVYDTALLYNLGHLSAHGPGILVAAAALVVARVLARARAVAEDRPPSHHPPGHPGPGIDTLATALVWFTALFFVPALSIRYAIGFADVPLAGLAGAAVAVVAAALTVRDVYGRLTAPKDRRAVIGWVAGAVLAVAVGALAATGARLVAAPYPEYRLLLAAALFMTAATAALALSDRLTTTGN